MKDARKAELVVKEAASALNAEPEQLPAAIKKFQKDLEGFEKDISSIKRELK